MRKHRVLLAGVGFAFLMTGCAAETSEFKSLREQVRVQQKQIVDLKARQQEHQAKLEILENGFKIIGDKVDENSRSLDSPRGGRSMMPSAPIVSAPIASAPVPAPSPRTVAPPSRAVAPPAPAVAARPAPPQPITVEPPMTAADLYRSALDNFTQENFRRAVLEFEEFVANYPEHDLADNAQYWIGECYYAQKNFQQAAVEFGKVEKHFAAGNKAVAAILKKGLALKELGRNEEAMAALEKVVQQYPTSDEAVIAEKRLSQWR